MNFSPIVLFTYNRPSHTSRTLESLSKNEYASESILYIYSDAAKDNDAYSKTKVKEVRRILKNIVGFKKVIIIEREKNLGLANSIIQGVTEIVNQYGKVIVLEDDMLTNKYFLKYMNEALNMYINEPKVASIHGYLYPNVQMDNNFFIKGANCWGWATWKEKWAIFETDGKKLLSEVENRKLEKFANFNDSYDYVRMLKNQIKGKNNSWAIRWYFSTLLNDMYTLNPMKTYIQNIGTDGGGTHFSNITKIYDVYFENHYFLEKIDIKENEENRKQFENFYLKTNLNTFEKGFNLIIRKIKLLIKRVNSIKSKIL